MRFIVGMDILNVDGTNVPREMQGDDFTNAIESYMSAIEHSKGEILWGSDAIEAKVTFTTYGVITEITRIRYSLGGQLEVIATQE